MTEPPSADYLAEHPTERMLAAESRRDYRALLDRSSFGTPGARAVIKRGRGEELTVEEAEAAEREMEQLGRELSAMAQRSRARRRY